MIPTASSFWVRRHVRSAPVTTVPIPHRMPSRASQLEQAPVAAFLGIILAKGLPLQSDIDREDNSDGRANNNCKRLREGIEGKKSHHNESDAPDYHNRQAQQSERCRPLSRGQNEQPANCIESANAGSPVRRERAIGRCYEPEKIMGEA